MNKSNVPINNMNIKLSIFNIEEKFFDKLLINKNIGEINYNYENLKFETYLNEDWEIYLNENPLFATYVGDKRFNDIIKSNSIDVLNDSKKSDTSSLNKLRQINQSILSDENKLNYRLFLDGYKNSADKHQYQKHYQHHMETHLPVSYTHLRAHET